MNRNYEGELSRRNLSTKTVEIYQNDLKAFSDWYENHGGGGIFSPEFITPRDIRNYREHLLAVENRKATTINRKIASISVYFEWLVGLKVISDNPVNKTHWLDLPELVPKYLDRRQQLSLYRVMEKDLQVARLHYPKRWIVHRRNMSLVIFLLNTGLRLDESLKLKKEDIEMTDRAGKVQVRSGKGSKPRTVPLNLAARNALKEWYQVQPESASSYVWTAMEKNSGEPLSARAVQRVFERYAVLASIETFTPHVARSTFAKNLLDSGVSIEKVASLLGHASLNTTRIYVTPSEGDLRNAVETISDLFN